MDMNTTRLNIRCAVYLPLYAPFGHPRIIADLARDDVIVSGETPANRPDQAEEIIAGNGAAGATWWLESLDPERSSRESRSFEQLRERVLAGPLGRN